MNDITHSMQSHNIESVRDENYLQEFIKSPYGLSLSFLKDPSIIGKEDEFGQLKYNLNLDEALVDRFYQIIREGEDEITVHQNIFLESITNFRHYIEDYLNEDDQELESKYQIVLPFVLRGIIIQLMNDFSTPFINELIAINQQLSSLINCYKDAGVYFERFLVQLSTPQFLRIVRRIQEQITDFYEQQS